VAGRVLVDTNVLVCLIDPRDPAKQARSAEVMRRLHASRCGVLSQQVLSEFARVASERVPEGPTRAEVIEAVRDLSTAFDVLPVTSDVIAEALALAGRMGRSFWDAQLVAIAKMNGIATILSEDFEDGAACEGVRFADPFQEGFSPESLGL
jgi:predicted nucleic acid-binding protein